MKPLHNLKKKKNSRRENSPESRNIKMLYSHKYFIISLNFQIIKNVLLDFCVVFPKLGIFVIINQIYWAWQFEKKKKREVLVQPTLGQGLLSWIRNQMT